MIKVKQNIRTWAITAVNVTIVYASAIRTQVTVRYNDNDEIRTKLKKEP